MPLAHLIKPDFERYVADNHDAGSCWFFVHIPKTAGSSFGAELAHLLSPNVNVHIDDDQRSVPRSQKMADAMRAFDERLKQGPCRFASGHVPITTLAQHVDGWRELKLITMLRDPVERVVSNYRYQTTPAHPSHRRFIEDFPTLESYIESIGARNKMFRFLRPSAEASMEECKDFIVRHFAFVGQVESYSQSFRLMMKLLGDEREPSHHVRRTVETTHNRLQMNSALVERICNLNSLDIELYDYFRERVRLLWSYYHI